VSFEEESEVLVLKVAGEVGFFVHLKRLSISEHLPSVAGVGVPFHVPVDGVALYHVPPCFEALLRGP
jgi:hypothetical protein